MRHLGNRPSGRGRASLAWSAGLLLACGLLLLPMTALSHVGGDGGGGGGGGGSGSGKNIVPEPMTGIEGLPVMPEDGYWSEPHEPEAPRIYKPGGPDTDPSLVEKLIWDKIKSTIIKDITAVNPPAGWTIWTIDQIASINEKVKKLKKHNKEYEKAISGIVGSNTAPPPPGPDVYGPSYSGGGGPQEGMESIGLW